MTSTQRNSPLNENSRNNKMNSLRTTLKAFSIMKKRSSDLEVIFAKKQQKLKINDARSNNSQASQTLSLNNEDLEDLETDEFFDNYQLKEKIGEGCNATVYRCVYKPSGKIYAVKKMRIDKEHVPAMKRDFITLKEINHPSICHYKALYIKIQQRTAFLVMEYLSLPNIANYYPESQDELRIIVRELLEVLDYLHTRNICHRDIKPENILFDKKTKKIKVIDFGISKKTFLRGQRRQMLTIIGTHYYMAPEIFLGGGYDERVDLWSLGVAIFKIVAGYTPFESQYYSEIIKKIQAGVVNFDFLTWSKYSFNLKNFVQSLIKPVQNRITLEQAKKHLWLMSGQNKQKKLISLSSHSYQIEPTFQSERMKLRHAVSKEEGCIIEQKRLFRSIKILENDIFQLEDSDDDDHVVSPILSSPDNKYLQTPQPSRNPEAAKDHWQSSKLAAFF